ncbi:MAG: HAD-IB family hydrolase [Actinomycetes bacterium]|jgi:HAD superfamily hydrolase (TIGR01490 family)|nr:MAG: HAD-IB family hydrolase [Actinomycetota bacterium]
MTEAAAYFDLDRTLISGASVLTLGVAAWRQGFATNAEIARWARDAIVFKLFGDKGDGDAAESTRQDMLTRIAGASVESLKALEAEVTPNLIARVRPESRDLIEMHHSHGRDTWIVSASPQPLVEPLAAALGMTGAIGTRGEIIDGHYTGRLDGPFVYGPGKAEAIEKLAQDRGYDLQLCYAYSDSVSDLPMLELVGHPVAVNPDGELTAVARQRGWPIVIFARKTKQALAVAGMSTAVVASGLIGYAIGRRRAR